MGLYAVLYSDRSLFSKSQSITRLVWLDKIYWETAKQEGVTNSDALHLPSDRLARVQQAARLASNPSLPLSA